jgi:hypothetical protein
MRRFCLSLYIMVTAASAQTPPSSKEYASLTLQILCCPIEGQEKTFKLPAAELIERITSQLHNMVTETVQLALAVPNASSGSVQEAMRDLQGQFALSALRGNQPFNVPFADVSSVNGTPVALAVFAVLRSGDVLSYFQFYANLGGIWKLQSEIASAFKGAYFSVERVESGMPGEVRYVVWGRVPGDPDGASKGSIYSFDGATAKIIWQKSDLFFARVSVSGDEIRLQHLTDSPTPGGGKILVPPKRQSAPDFQILHDTALTCRASVAQQDAAAAAVIKNFRAAAAAAHAANTPHPPHPSELTTMQQQRDGIVTGCAAQLQQAMSPNGYQKLDQFLHQQLVKHVQVKPPAALIRKGQKQPQGTKPPQPATAEPASNGTGH